MQNRVALSREVKAVVAHSRGRGQVCGTQGKTPFCKTGEQSEMEREEGARKVGTEHIRKDLVCRARGLDSRPCKIEGERILCNGVTKSHPYLKEVIVI